MGLFFDKKLERKELLFFLYYAIVVFLSGFFLSTFDIIVHINFFNYFGYKYLASAYIISGLFGVAITFLYAELYKRIGTKLFFFLVLTFIILISSVFYFWHFIDNFGYAYYFGMVILFPINTLMLLVLWRFGRKLLYPEKTRKLFPIIKSSLLLGLIFGAGTFAIGLFFIELRVLILISLLVLLSIWPLHLLLLFSLRKAGIEQKITERFIPGKNNFFILLNSKYTSYLLFFVLLSSIVGYTINFAFVNVAWIAFKTDLGMAKFYGLFIATMALFILGMDRFLIKKILYSYDSPYGLPLISVLLFLAIVAVIGVNFLVVSAQTIVDHFSVFFLFLAILKVTYTSLNITVQLPAIRTLFHSLDLRYRQIAYPRLEGTIIMAGLTVAGLIILAFTFLKFYSLTIILLFAIVTSIVWIIVGIKLLRHYHKAVGNNLSNMRLKKTAIQENKRFEEHLSSFFATQDSDKTIIAMGISKVFQPLVYEHDLIRLLAHPSSDIHSYVLENIISESVYAALPLIKVKHEQAKGIQNEMYENIINTFEERQKVKVNEFEIDNKLYDADDKEREKLIEGIENIEEKEISNTLISLIKDSNIEIRNRAIKTLAKINQGNLNYPLIEFLYPDNYNPYAFEAIAASKDNALEYLEHEALLPSTNNIVLSRIIRLYGKIGTTRAIQNLISNLDNNDSFIMNQSIEVLFDIRFQASNVEKLKIQGYFVKRISLLAFTLKIYQDLDRRKNCQLLAQAYLFESERNIDLLFKLLSLIYNPGIIFSLKRLFKNGSRAEISHAVELMDEHITEDIKPLFQILVEDISLSEKNRRLDYYFPQRKYNLREIIALSLTYDFNSLSLYTRCCALVLIDYFKLDGFIDEMRFCSGHPNFLLSETAHFTINRMEGRNSSKQKYKRKEFTKFIKSEEYKSLLFYKFYKLKTFDVINQLNENIIIELVRTVKTYSLKNGEKLFTKDLDDISLLITDKIILDRKGGISLEFGNNFVHMDLLNRKGIDCLMLNEPGIIWGFDKATIEILLFDNIELANAILTSIENFKIIEHGNQDG